MLDPRLWPWEESRSQTINRPTEDSTDASTEQPADRRTCPPTYGNAAAPPYMRCLFSGLSSGWPSGILGMDGVPT